MNYLEPFVGSGCVLLEKDPSKEEVLNDGDCGIVSIWRAVRDEHGEFATRIKRMRYSDASFKRHQAAKEFDDYLAAATAEFALRHMSKNGTKKTFIPRSREAKCSELWKHMLDSLESIRERIRESYFLSRCHEEILGAFNKDDTLVYCDPPPVDEDSMGADRHLKLGDMLKAHRGKVVVVGPNTAIYKRMYSEWNRKGLPGNPKESLWTNF
jgi:DNA adenine methylase